MRTEMKQRIMKKQQMEKYTKMVRAILIIGEIGDVYALLEGLEEQGVITENESDAILNEAIDRNAPCTLVSLKNTKLCDL